MLARLVDHRGRQIDAGRVPAHLREGRNHESRAARDIEHGVFRPCARKFDQQPQRVLAAHRGRIRERRSLPRELVDDDVGVGCHREPLRMRNLVLLSQSHQLASARFGQKAERPAILARRSSFIAAGVTP